MNVSLISVDSGATRTRVTVEFSESGNSRRYHSAHVLAGTTPPSQYEGALYAILARAAEIVSEPSDVERVYIFIGSAGFSHARREDFEDAMRVALPRMFHDKAVVAAAANDGTSLLLGHEADAVVIAGTGSTVMLRVAEEIFVAAGHDWVGCDYGSGFWIGLRGIRRATRDFENGVDSELTDFFRETYAVRDDRNFGMKLRELALVDADMKGEIARFATAVCRSAEIGDPAAQDIVKIEAEDLADASASALRRQLGSDRLARGVKIVQSGGLLNNDFYRDIFETQMGRRLKNREGDIPSIRWSRFDGGSEAVTRLVRALQSEPESLMVVDRRFRPLVVSVAG